MPWQEIEASLAGAIARKVKAGKKTEDIDLFGPVVHVSGGGGRTLASLSPGHEYTGSKLSIMEISSVTCAKTALSLHSFRRQS
jgi:hypothetical protein